YQLKTSIKIAHTAFNIPINHDTLSVIQDILNPLHLRVSKPAPSRYPLESLRTVTNYKMG
ncbi:MAG: hypothetical protein QXH34_08055, partial [Ignisphaera sp.]